MSYALALASVVLAAACAQGDRPNGSVAYYRTHPAEWERAVWICTNDGSAVVSTIGCANALALLHGPDIGKAPEEPSGASSLASSRRMARD